MKEKFLILLVLAMTGLCIFSFTGCKNYAVSTKKDPTCRTIVSGYMHYPVLYTFKPPVLVVKQALSNRILKGKIIEKTDQGYVFDPMKMDNWDGPARLYKFSEIVCLLDSNSTILYGQVPVEYIRRWKVEMSFVPASQPDDNPVILVARYNAPFSYCLPPGSYYLKSMEFIRTEDYSDVSEKMPDIRLDVEMGKDNYIGDFYFDMKNSSNPISCRPGRRPSDAAASQFGLIGAMINEASKANESDKIHTIDVKNELPPDDKRKVSIMKINYDPFLKIK